MQSETSDSYIQLLLFWGVLFFSLSYLLWSSYICSSRTILEKYLRRAVQLAEDIKPIDKKSIAQKSKTNFHLAHYADALFRSYEERLASSEWQAALRLRKHKVSMDVVQVGIGSVIHVSFFYFSFSLWSNFVRETNYRWSHVIDSSIYRRIKTNSLSTIVWENQRQRMWKGIGMSVANILEVDVSDLPEDRVGSIDHTTKKYNKMSVANIL